MCLSSVESLPIECACELPSNTSCRLQAGEDGRRGRGGGFPTRGATGCHEAAPRQRRRAHRCRAADHGQGGAPCFLLVARGSSGAAGSRSPCPCQRENPAGGQTLPAGQLSSEGTTQRLGCRSRMQDRAAVDSNKSQLFPVSRPIGRLMHHRKPYLLRRCTSKPTGRGTRGRRRSRLWISCGCAAFRVCLNCMGYFGFITPKLMPPLGFCAQSV